jgi:photosystem II stability/assembly factor-like uncharacterized protein
MVPVILASLEATMSTLTRPRPARPDLPPDAEAPEALIEEARRRARRRRRWYGACALVAVAGGLLGFYGFNGGGGGGAARSQLGAGQPEVGASITPQVSFGRWKAAPGLEGGDVRELVFDPHHPSTVFALTENDGPGIFQSSDGGRNWRPLGAVPDASHLDALAIAPRHRRALYVGTEVGVFKTTDGGASWQTASAGLLGKETAQERKNRLEMGYVRALFVDPRDPETLYAGTEEGLFKSTDGGAHWQGSLANLADVGRVGALAFDPTDTEAIYAGTEPGYAGVSFGSGVFKSTDGGRTWSSLGLQKTNVAALAVDPQHSETIYAATRNGSIFKSTDGGGRWRAIGRHQSAYGTFLFDPQNPETVYASEGDRIFKSSDGGRKWRTLHAGRRMVMLGFDPRTSRTLYARDLGRPVDLPGAGILMSTNGGTSWRDLSPGPTTASVRSLVLAPRKPATVLAATDRGVFKRTRGAWQAVANGVKSLDFGVLALTSSDPGTIYAGAGHGVFKSTDRGFTWQALRGSPSTEISALAVDPRKPTTVYATASKRGVFKSVDGGGSWEKLAAGFATTSSRTALVLDPRDPDTVWAGGVGLYRSSDGGRTWRSLGLTNLAVHALALDPKEPGIVYVATGKGVLKSLNHGESWQALPGPLKDAEVEALAIDPRHRNTVYVGTDRGVFLTADGGHSWRRFTRLPLRTFDALAIDRAAGMVYAGAYGGGIFELRLGH